ncbi:MAG: hypothetical protein Kow0090_13360 [Myxococcota bacterium]
MKLASLFSISFFLGFELKALILCGILYLVSTPLFILAFAKSSKEAFLFAHYLFKLALIIQAITVLIRIVGADKLSPRSQYEELLFASFIIVLAYAGFRRSWANIHLATPFVALIGASPALLLFLGGEAYDPNPYIGAIKGVSFISATNFLSAALGVGGVASGALFALVTLLFGLSPLKKLPGDFALGEKEVNLCFFESARTASFAIPLLVLAIIGKGMERLSSGGAIIPSAPEEVALVAALIIASGSMYMYSLRYMRFYFIIPWTVLGIFPALIFLFKLPLPPSFDYILILLTIIAFTALILSLFHPQSQRVTHKPKPVNPAELTAAPLTVGIEHRGGLKRFIMAAKGLGYKYFTETDKESGYETGYLVRGIPAVPASVIYHCSVVLLALFVLVNLTQKQVFFSLESPAPEPLSSRITDLKFRSLSSDYYRIPELKFGDNILERLGKVFSFSPEGLGFTVGETSWRAVKNIELSGREQKSGDEVRFKVSSNEGIQLAGGFLVSRKISSQPLFLLSDGSTATPEKLPSAYADSNEFLLSLGGKSFIVSEFREGGIYDSTGEERSVTGEALVFANDNSKRFLGRINSGRANSLTALPNVLTVERGRVFAEFSYYPVLFGPLLVFLSIIVLTSIAVRVFGKWHRIYFVIREESLYFNVETPSFFIDKKVLAEYLISALI